VTPLLGDAVNATAAGEHVLRRNHHDLTGDTTLTVDQAWQHVKALLPAVGAGG
jgi:hypothetical protein